MARKNNKVPKIPRRSGRNASAIMLMVALIILAIGCVLLALGTAGIIDIPLFHILMPGLVI